MLSRYEVYVANSPLDWVKSQAMLATEAVGGNATIQVDRVESDEDRCARPFGDRGRAAFDRVFSLQERPDGSFQMFAEIPSGRRIWVIWRYDRDDEIQDPFAESQDAPIFVITAY